MKGEKIRQRRTPNQKSPAGTRRGKRMCGERFAEHPREKRMG